MTGTIPFRIAGTGTGFPDGGTWWDNDRIHELRFGTDWRSVMQQQGLDPEYYEQRLGVKRRYWVHRPGTAMAKSELTTVDLMEAAAKDAMANAGIGPGEVDALIGVTITSPFYTTAVSAHIANRTGINAPAFDMRSGCATAIFAMVTAAQLLRDGARNVLIVAGDTTSKIIDPASNMMYVGGDAGAAVVVSQPHNEAEHILSYFLGTDGSFATHTGVEGSLPPVQEDLDAARYFLFNRDDGKEARLKELWTMIPAELYERSGLSANDIACYAPHQVLKPVLAHAAASAGLPHDRVVDVLGDYGNCGPATALLALHRARTEQRYGAGDKLMIGAAGGGLSYGGIVLQQ